MITLSEIISEKIKQDRNRSPTENRVWFISPEDFEELKTLLKDPESINISKIFGFNFRIKN